MRAYYLESSSITAHELLALGVDVVVCSYDQVVASERARKALLDELDRYNNDQTRTLKKPKRPDAALHSSIWRDLKLPIKRLVLDEAQLVNKRNGVRHKALKALYYEAVLALSGTPGHNHYHGFSGIVDFLSGHPFTTHKLFMKTFSSLDYEGKIDRPDLSRIRLLQRFLQAFTIARPSDILKLKDCIRYRSSFTIRASQLSTIVELFRQYQLVNIIDIKNRKSAPTGADVGNAVALLFAVEAQMLSLHPLLYSNETKQKKLDDFDDFDEDDPVYGYVSADKETKGGLERDLWLQKLRDCSLDELVGNSDRLRQFILVYKQLRATNPSQKILVFSQFLKFLDIIAEGLKRIFNVNALRYDGKVDQAQRPKVEQEFKRCNPSVPLLMTAGAGALGLNVTAASIVIQCEIWWNLNNEWQAIRRVWRQLQELQVLCIQLFASNSPIDLEMWKVQTIKATINDELMEAIFRRPDEGPDIRDLLFPRAMAASRFDEFRNT
jgi:SNF2 family DNA or RNA helicase